MATVKLKFRPSSVPGTKGTLYYQMTHKRKVKWISTGYHIFPNEWDEKDATIVATANEERKAELLLMRSTIEWELRRHRENIHKLEASNKDVTLDNLCDAFKQTASCKTVFPFLQEQIARQERMRKQGTYMTYINACRRFKEFRKELDLTFDELTPDMRKEYEAWLIHRGLKQNTIRFYLRTFNTLLHKAADDELLDKGKELFRHVRLSYVKTAKRAISADHIRAIRQLQLPQDSIEAFARDIFMFSFYMRGMPFVDIAFLKKADLTSGLLSYRRKKTNRQLTIE